MPDACSLFTHPFLGLSGSLVISSPLLPILDDAPAQAIGELPIAETFVSLQGEGKLTGVPSWFCRVSGCNLRCVWCDTPFASWRPEGARRSLDALVAEGTSSGPRHAVLTGGEPLLFAGVEELARRLREAGLHITIETAGTIDSPAHADLLSISPKLATSTPTPEQSIALSGSPAWSARHEARRVNLAALQGLIDRQRARRADVQLKFVACQPRDLAEVEQLLARLSGWSPADVLLMPEGVTEPSREQLVWVSQACVERGWRFCTRLHIQLYGHTRGT